MSAGRDAFFAEALTTSDKDRLQLVERLISSMESNLTLELK